MTDLVCASSACPDDVDPANAWDPTDVHVRVYSPEHSFSTAIARRVTPESDAVLTEKTGFGPCWAPLTRNVVEYAGYWLPSHFNDEGAVAEYWACREQAAVMDLSPLRKFEVLGPDAETLTQATITRDARRLSTGQVVYTALCNDQGGMVDECTVFRLGQDNFRFVVGHDGVGIWLREQAERLGLAKVHVKASIDQLHNIAVQGPNSREILRRFVWAPATQPSIDELGWFRFLVGRVGEAQGVPIVVSRTGYTGELGYEIFCHPSDAVTVWDAVWEAGGDQGLAPLGLDALDILRIESGLIAVGQRIRRPDRSVRSRHRVHRRPSRRRGLRRPCGAHRPPGSPATGARGVAARGQRDRRARRPACTWAASRWGRSPAAPARRSCGRPSRWRGSSVQHAELGTALEIGKLDGMQKRIAAEVVRFPFYDPGQDPASFLAAPWHATSSSRSRPSRSRRSIATGS